MQFITRFNNLFDFAGINYFPVIGNHEHNNSNGSSTATQLSLKQVQLACYSKKRQVVFSDFTAYYFDDDLTKCRYYFVGTKQSSQLFDEDVGWIIHSFLTIPDGYSVVIYSHAGLKYDEDYNILKEYYGVNATYRAPNGAEMMLSLSPVSDNANSQEARAASSGCVVGETAIKIYRDHYKFVPEAYEKTPEDIAAEAGGHYYISFGADKIEERDIVSADVVLNDVNYTFYFDNAAECSDEMLIQMASELHEAAKQ